LKLRGTETKTNQLYIILTWSKTRIQR